MGKLSNGAMPPLGTLSGTGGRFVDWQAMFPSPDVARRLPFVMRLILENCLRNAGPGWAEPEDIARLVRWRPGEWNHALPLRVSRVIMPDSSGLPALMDLAVLRDVLAAAGVDPHKVQPQIPADLVIDHSVTVDHFGREDAARLNVQVEYARNDERYRFFKWAETAFDNFRIVPPGMGIVHQVHLERLARVVDTREDGVVFPEFVLGGDSHTPMVNGLGVLAWGVGGVEIESALLGEPYVMATPKVVGVRLVGELTNVATITDLVLTITQILRRTGVTGAFVEFFGPGYRSLTVPDRATVANMAPEYGATAAYFPLDENSLDYLRQTGRETEHVALIEAFARQSGLFFNDDEPLFDEVVEIDLAGVEPSLAGPKRPQDRVALRDTRRSFRQSLLKHPKAHGFGLQPAAAKKGGVVEVGGRSFPIGHGSLAIAAITACTSTSNPSAMLAAGLLARRAVERGMTVPSYVKTSLAPGSLVVPHYLSKLGLLEPLEKLGFYIVGFGCTTCSGKSGPLVPEMAKAIEDNELIAAAVVSSNRNFEGRLHRQVRAGYLASPPLVIAFALAGRIDIDLSREPVGLNGDGKPVFLTDLWPDRAEIASLMAETRRPEDYRRVYGNLFEGTQQWQKLPAVSSTLFPWNRTSSYILPPPFFGLDARGRSSNVDTLRDARVIGLYGDSLTTDHISPAGEIPLDSDAGRYLSEKGVAPPDFNAYTMRRGNHHVMKMGTYANVRIQNRLVPGIAGGVTLKLPERQVTSVVQAAAQYGSEGTPLIVIGGRDYGMGSSRDWAAKGPRLLNVQAVIAVSFERIHRSNLVALGILPLTFEHGEDADRLGLDGTETYTLRNLRAAIATGAMVGVEAVGEGGRATRFLLKADFSSRVEREIFDAGGIFSRVRTRLQGLTK